MDGASGLVEQQSLTLGEWLEQGPFGLAMSSGFFGFFAHCGMLAALEQAGLRPVRVSGASAGSLTAAGWASGLDSAAIAEVLRAMRREHFWDPAPGPGVLRGKRFERRVGELLGIERFEQCEVPLAVSVHDLVGRRTRVLESGPLARALVASCAVPGMFHPVWISGRPHVDGGVSDHGGLAGMDAERVLYHHLVPHFPFPPVRLADRLRPNMVTVASSGLPRVGPFRLEYGPQALEASYDAMRRALDQPVGHGLIEMQAP
jgi:NTE family protein